MSLSNPLVLLVFSQPPEDSCDAVWLTKVRCINIDHSKLLEMKENAAGIFSSSATLFDASSTYKNEL